MRESIARLASVGVLVVATATFTGIASAGGGQGNGGDGGSGGGDSSGQVQKQDGQSQGQGHDNQSYAGSIQTKTDDHSSSSDHAQKSDGSKHSSDSGSSKHDSGQSSDQSSQAGVKPSSETKHWTKTKVGDSPDVSKRYGNGNTAAEIAKSRGAKADVELVGPGNSQPHKVCGRDVHAVKSYDENGSCGSVKAEQKTVKAVEQKPADVQSCGKDDDDQGKNDDNDDHGSCGGVAADQKTVKAEEQKPVVATCGQTVVTVPGGVLHKTGNGEYVLIHPSESSAHYQGKHEDDVVLADRQVVVSNGESCGAVQSVQQQTEQKCAPVTTTQEVETQAVDGIWHKTGSEKNSYVLIHPSGNSAHWTKHEDDIPNVVTVKKTVLVTTTPASCETAAPATASVATTATETTTTAVAAASATQSTTSTTPVVQVQSAAMSQTAPGAQPATQSQPVAVAQQPQGGVAGVQASLNQPTKSNGGVLGAAGNIAGASLPFTGFPLWAAVLIAIALIAAGLMLRRRGPNAPRI